jgi:hypothetical protein
MLTFTIRSALYVLLGAAGLLHGTGCSLIQGTYYPLEKGAPGRNQAAAVTELSDAELQAQGYQRIGFITRLWNPEQNKLFWDFRSSGGDLPGTDPFHKGFTASLREQAGKAGGDLLKREPDRGYQNDNPVLVVNVEGSHWTEAERSLEFKRLTWSVWRRAEETPGHGNDT